jgi:hypothetical protein
MKEPYFALIMLRVETCINQADHEAREEALIVPKDSSVKSALRKAELGLGGKKPLKPPKDALEVWIAGLAELLVETAKELEQSDGVSKGDVLRTLGAVRESLDTRREMANSPRGYLDFLDGFLSRMRDVWLILISTGRTTPAARRIQRSGIP